MRTYFWSFGNQWTVNIDDREPPGCKDRLDAAEDFLTVDPFDRGIGVWKVVSYIPFTDCAQKCVRDGVCEDIGIGVAIEAAIVRDFNAAENQLSACRKTMHIVTNSNAIHG